MKAIGYVLVMTIAGGVTGLVLRAGAQVQRQYYLTKTTVPASQAAGSCATGYHMASIFEIEETSNVRYQTNLGQTSGDSGSGPPLGFPFWARTGLPGLNQSCNAWTTDDPNDQGFTFILAFPSNAAGRQQFGHWVADLISCSSKARVACIQD
jgi:hypothetical protein